MKHARTGLQIFLYFIKHEVEELVVTLEDAGDCGRPGRQDRLGCAVRRGEGRGTDRRTFAAAGELDADALVHVLCEVEDGLAFWLIC